MPRRHLPLLLLCAACAREGPAEPRPAVEAPATEVRACDPLPDALPPGLSMRVSRTVVPHGGMPRRELGEIVGEAAACTTPPHCRVVSPETLEQVYGVVRERLPATLTWRRARHSPHFGTRFVQVSWEGGRCEVGEGHEAALDDAGREALMALFAAIGDAFQEGEAP